jgi:predicted deacylase
MPPIRDPTKRGGLDFLYRFSVSSGKCIHMAKTPLWADRPEGRFFIQVDVAPILSGSMLSVGLHVLTGRQSGPTLGVIGGVHGDETLTPMAFQILLDALNPARVSGRLVIIPVANPLSMAAFNRQTPEQHGNTDLHTVFPGNPNTGNLTHKLAIAIQDNLLDHVDAFVDFHSGGSGGRLQNRSDFEENLSPDIREKCLELCRAFGAPFIHANSLSKSASSYVNARGKPACNAEVGGAYLSPETTRTYLDRMVGGLKGIMSVLGMLPDFTPAKPKPQLLFNVKSRIEVNPNRGGFLVSEFETPSDLGRRIAKGTRLGKIFDMHRLEAMEDLLAPVDGYLFFSRYSGAVDAGTKAFALAEEAHSQWLN